MDKRDLLGALFAACLLAGCASAPAVPYWQNPKLINSMAHAIHNHVQYPSGLNSHNQWAGVAVVQFNYDAGHISNAAMVTSTGDRALDSAILSQVSQVTLPKARGADTHLPHRFQISLSMVSPDLASFFRALHEDLQQHTYYPESAVRAGIHGVVLAHFSYRDGVIFDPAIYKSSGSHILDASVLNEIKTIQAPSAPAWMQGRTVQFTVPVGFCFSRPCIETVYKPKAG